MGLRPGGFRLSLRQMKALLKNTRLPATLALFVFMAQPLSILRAAPPSLPDISVGDDQATVLSVLGEPRGYAGSDRFLILSFERGEVILRNGVVSSFDLISQAELEARKEAQRQREIALEEKREQRIAEGRLLLQTRLGDSSFGALPPSARLAFWEAFQHKYPEIDVELHHRVAERESLLERKALLAELEREQRLRELEFRVREAEMRAENAEQEARRQRQQPLVIRSFHPVFYSHPRPVDPPPCQESTGGNRVVVRSGGNGSSPVLAPAARNREQIMRERFSHISDLR